MPGHPVAINLRRLAPIAAAITAVLLVFTGIIIVYSGERAYRQQKVDEFKADARVLASTVVAALTFDDGKAAENYVDALEVNPEINAAVVYGPRGTVFAAYKRSGAFAIPAHAPIAGETVQADDIAVTSPITHDDAVIGTVYVRGTLDPIARRVQRYGVIGLLIAIAALVTTALGVAHASLTRANRELSEANANLASEIGQREIAEEALRQAQKMEAIGQLTGGVAHDFNNILQVVLGNLGILEQRLGGGPGNDRVYRSLQAAISAGERAAALTRQLLAFSRRQPLNPQLVEVNKLIASMSNLLHRTLGETIEIETVLGARLWPAFADANQLESAILNLAVNARDAMPGGGKLTIETANCYLDEAYAASERDVIAGQYVVIAVSDAGTGMTRETIEKAFDPFFTTKEVGHGTGLGLSQVYGFIKQSGGHVKIYSEVGEGTTIKLYLPRTVTQGSAPGRGEPLEPALPLGDGEVILVVEDAADVRNFVTEVLRELGYTVLEAGEASAALELIKSGAHLDLLFTDVGLPGGINGRQLAEQATREQPGVKVLYTTGYARNAIVHQGRLDPGVEVINKPFTYNALAARVRDVLDAA